MYNPLLMIDFYKATHAEQYPKDMTMIYSLGTPRMSRLEDVDKLVFFGGQAFCKEYLIKTFNEYFFSQTEEEVVIEYNRILTNTLGAGSYSDEKVRKLHRLGYLPIAMYAIPEGMSTSIGVPQVAFVNTHPDFAWLTNTLETAFSAYIWHIQIAAEVGRRYRAIVEKYHTISCEPEIRVASLLGDFSMRGQHSIDAAINSSAAWLLSFRNTATVPAIMWLEDNYNCNCKEEVGFGAISTEHSCMCSNFAIDGDEITHIKRLLTEIYPNHGFSMVSDSYDYWHLVNDILPQCKEEILNHNGYLAIRGDSGDPVSTVTQTVFRLWDIFGGSINSKGYKVLNPHIKAIYGDSITPERCEQIYNILVTNGFAINNVSLGVGSFSFMCLTQDDKFIPYTRDTFGYAIKATYGECNGKPVMIMKQPKATAWKKSQRGCCIVDRSGLSYQDGLTFEEAHGDNVDNLLELVFKDGEMVREMGLASVRSNLYPQGF